MSAVIGVGLTGCPDVQDNPGDGGDENGDATAEVDDCVGYCPDNDDTTDNDGTSDDSNTFDTIDSNDLNTDLNSDDGTSDDDTSDDDTSDDDTSDDDTSDDDTSDDDTSDDDTSDDDTSDDDTSDDDTSDDGDDTEDSWEYDEGSYCTLDEGASLSCPYAQGFWLNNPDEWPIETSGECAPDETSAGCLCGETWMEVLEDDSSDGAWETLARQWISALLSAHAGVCTAESDAIISEAAEQYLFDCHIPDEEHDDATDLADELDAFNRGETIEGCSDD